MSEPATLVERLRVPSATYLHLQAAQEIERLQEHYECALREIERLRVLVEEALVQGRRP